MVSRGMNGRGEGFSNEVNEAEISRERVGGGYGAVSALFMQISLAGTREEMKNFNARCLYCIAKCMQNILSVCDLPPTPRPIIYACVSVNAKNMRTLPELGNSNRISLDPFSPAPRAPRHERRK